MDNAKNTITINEVMPDAEARVVAGPYTTAYYKEPGNNTRLFFLCMAIAAVHVG